MLCFLAVSSQKHGSTDSQSGGTISAPGAVTSQTSQGATRVMLDARNSSDDVSWCPSAPSYRKCYVFWLFHAQNMGALIACLGALLDPPWKARARSVFLRNRWIARHRIIKVETTTGDGNANLSKFRIWVGTGRYVFLTLDQ